MIDGEWFQLGSDFTLKDMTCVRGAISDVNFFILTV